MPPPSSVKKEALIFLSLVSTMDRKKGCEGAAQDPRGIRRLGA